MPEPSDTLIRVPRALYGPNGEIGETFEDIGPDHPEYQDALRSLEIDKQAEILAAKYHASRKSQSA